jgi:hypothetical protein
MTLSLLLLVASAALSQGGGLPSIFGEGSSARGLPEGTERAVEDVCALEGGSFGVVVKNLASGETVSRNAGSSFDVGNPDLVLVTAAVDFVEAGELDLDAMPGPDESIEQIIRWTAEGNDEAAVKIYCSAGKERFPAWLSENGFDDTEFNSIYLDWEADLDIEVNEPNYSTPSDYMGILEHLAERLDAPVVRRLTRDPLSGNSQVNYLQERFAAVYGTSSLEAGGSSRALILVFPDGTKIGVVLLADELCCPSKADLALEMILQALSGT